MSKTCRTCGDTMPEHRAGKSALCPTCDKSRDRTGGKVNRSYRMANDVIGIIDKQSAIEGLDKTSIVEKAVRHYGKAEEKS